MSEEQVIEGTEQGSTETVDTPSDTSQDQIELAQSIFLDTEAEEEPSPAPEEPAEEVDEPKKAEHEDSSTEDTPDEEATDEDGYELFGRKYKSQEVAEQSLEEKAEYLSGKQSELDKLRNELEEKQNALESQLEEFKRTNRMVSPEEADAGREFSDWYKDKPQQQKELLELLRRQGHPSIGAAGIYSEDPAVRELQTQLEQQQQQLALVNRDKSIQKFRTDNHISEGQMNQIVSRSEELAQDHFQRTGVKVEIPFEVARKTLQADNIPTLIADVTRRVEERVRAEMAKGKKAKSVGAGGQVNKGKPSAEMTAKEREKLQLELAKSVLQ
jgi:hypothetical protein